MNQKKKRTRETGFDKGRFRYLIEASKYRTRRIERTKRKSTKKGNVGYLIPFSSTASD